MKPFLDRVIEICRRRFDSPAEVGRLVQGSKEAIPECLRARTLLMLYQHNPLFIDQVDAEARRSYRAAPALLRRGLEEAGFPVALAPELVPADYVDTLHLSVAGGNKVAAQAAPQVRRLARALGYVKEDER
jgi:hypothetical protein